MLRELIFESEEKIAGQRVISFENGIPKLEVSITGTGLFNGNIDSYLVAEFFLIELDDPRIQTT